jgi:endonuclease/exonuclease/phosphatase family metal-dependent hydrolase
VPWMRVAAGVVAVVLLIPDLVPATAAVVAVVVTQVGLTQAWLTAFAWGRTASRGAMYLAVVGGGILLFILLFGYYAPFGWHPLWPIGAALVVAAAVPGIRRPVVSSADWRWALGAVAVGVVGLAIGLMPRSNARPVDTPAPAELKVLSYNVFQGLGGDAVPDVPALADFIQLQDPDVASMYEVNRGWNISGAVEMVAYLEWRFPAYHFLSVPSGDELYANVIMSRYPITSSGTALHPQGKGLRRGYGWVTIPTDVGDLLYITSHLSNLSSDDRLIEANRLLALWQGRPHTIVAGDFNAEPDEQAVRALVGAGFKDVQAAHGLERAPTFSSLDPHERIDYVFTSPDITSLSAEIGSVLTSDHLPVIVSLRLT